MNTDTYSISDIITKSLEKTLTYQEYRNLVTDLAELNLSTGNDPKDPDLLKFSKLNDRRMKRLDKTIKIQSAPAEKIKAKTTNETWIVLTESWCGDAAQSIPVINKLAELNSNIDLKIALRDQNEDLMNEFLTNGGKSIPKLIVIDSETKEVLNSWGPRPTEATQMVTDYKIEHGKLTPEFKEALQLWYTKDKGYDVANDIANL